MRVLLDNNVNHRFAKFIEEHEVIHAREMGWGELENGVLISAAEANGFEVMITCDKNMSYQQSIVERKISIIVLNSLFIKLPYLVALAPRVNEMLHSGVPEGSFVILGP